MPDLLDTPIWGAAAIARYANIVDKNGKPNLRRAYHLLENAFLPGTKVGGKWTSTPRRLQRKFSGEDERTNTEPDQAA
jgi:hypothetical protein